jgi:hypothetical protein
MSLKEERSDVSLDALGLFLAGLINTFLALFVAAIILGPGSRSGQPDLLQRAVWIAENSLRWQAGWFFWFAVTLSFAWSFYALGRHLAGVRPWPALAIGVALIAAAVDIVGVLVNITVMPELARAVTGSAAELKPAIQVIFHSMESLSNALTNIAAFGLYTFAGLLLLPALFSTSRYPLWLAWLGTAEWVIAALATALLVIAPVTATPPLLVSFALYAPWVWGSAFWLLRNKPEN